MTFLKQRDTFWLWSAKSRFNSHVSIDVSFTYEKISLDERNMLFRVLQKLQLVAFSKLIFIPVNFKDEKSMSENFWMELVFQKTCTFQQFASKFKLKHLFYRVSSFSTLSLVIRGQAPLRNTRTNGTLVYILVNKWNMVLPVLLIKQMKTLKQLS